MPTKVRLVKAMVFPVVIYGCESWNMKKAERRRIDAFELLCWRRVLRVPWTARRSNQSILKETRPGCSLEELMLSNYDVGEDLRIPWTARRSNQSILKEISPGCSLEGMMLKLNSRILATSCEEMTHQKRL